MDISVTYSELTSAQRAELASDPSQNLGTLVLQVMTSIGAAIALIGGIILLYCVYGRHTYDFPSTAQVAFNYPCSDHEPFIDMLPASGAPLLLNPGPDLTYTISTAKLMNRHIGVLYIAGTWLVFAGGLLAIISLIWMLASLGGSSSALKIQLEGNQA